MKACEMFRNVSFVFDLIIYRLLIIAVYRSGIYFVKCLSSTTVVL